MSVLERLARVSPARRAARRASAPPWATPRPSCSWLQGTSKRPAGVVVDPPKQPAAAQLLVVHRPDLAACSPATPPGWPRARRACSSASPAPPPKPWPSTCGAPAPPSSSTTAPSPAKSASSPRRRFHRRHATPASSAPPRWSWASTWAISTACCRPRRRTRSAPSCSAWAAPAAATGRPPTPPSSARPPRACCRPSP